MKSVSKWRLQNSVRGNEITCFRFWWKSSSQSKSRLFLAFVFMTYHKKLGYWLQLYIIFEMVAILKV